MDNVFESLELDTTGMVTMPEDQLKQETQEKSQKESNTQNEKGAENTTETVVEVNSKEEQENSSTSQIDDFDNTGNNDNTSNKTLNDEVDPGLEVIYGQMRNFGLIDDLEEGEQLTEDYLRSKLPEMEEKAFLKSIEKLSPDTKQLLQFAFNNVGQDTPEKLREFFNQYVEPVTTSYKDNPREYLKDILKSNADKYLMTDKDIELKLEDWEEEGVLADKAKAAFEAKKTQLEQEKQKQLELAEENRKKQIERVQQFSQGVNEIVEQQGWGNEKQQQFLQTIQNAGQYNEMISSNPKAYVQMMNFLSYFNPEKGEFELDNWIAATASTKEANEKTKKMKQDLLSSAISRANKNTVQTSKSKKGADPLEIVITPEIQDLLK